MRFRRFITRFCQLPLLIVPIVLLSVVAGFVTGEAVRATALFARVVIMMILVTFAIGALIKFIYFKERPHPYEISKWWHRIDASSFPSIHTAYATVFMAQAILLADLMWRINGSQIGALLLAVVGIIFYIVIARSRIVLKKHFFIDTVFGTGVGLVGVAFCLTHMDAIVAAFQLFFGI